MLDNHHGGHKNHLVEKANHDCDTINVNTSQNERTKSFRPSMVTP